MCKLSARLNSYRKIREMTALSSELDAIRMADLSFIKHSLSGDCLMAKIAVGIARSAI